MLQTTRGLVFHVSRYSDSSGIAKIFTEDYGLQSFVVKSLFSRNAKMKPALFGHLSLIDMVFDHKPGRSLLYIREVTLNRPFHEITDNMRRSSVLLFINEVLYKSVKEEEANRSLFEFIEYSLESLNDVAIPVQSFHLIFLIRLSEHLGFGPSDSLTTQGNYFDLLTGLTEINNPGHSYLITGESLNLLRQLALMDYPDLVNFNASGALRMDLLDKLLDFYRIHLSEMTEMKSVKVLHEALQG
jgi:DNA repair protein RecO (recombination protein O)